MDCQVVDFYHFNSVYMQAIAREVVNPDLIDVTLDDIGGLDTIIEDLVCETKMYNFAT